MSTLGHISKMWKEFQSLPFPEKLVGKDINNICVTLLDSETAGIVSGFDGKLSQNRKEILASCLEDLDKIIPELDGEEKDYFQFLKDICVEVMKESK